MWEFYGQSNEIRENIKIKPEDKVEKPEALERYEQAKELGLPYVAGGLLDQPYIWVEEHGVITQFLKEWAVVVAFQNEQAQQQPPQKKVPNAREFQ